MQGGLKEWERLQTAASAQGGGGAVAKKASEAATEAVRCANAEVVASKAAHVTVSHRSVTDKIYTAMVRVVEFSPGPLGAPFC